MLCNICPRRCGAERTETRGGGVCAMPAGIVAAKAMLHQWEEPVLSGTNGAGCVFFSGCNLGCVFCQNGKISHENFGKVLSPARLREIFFELIAAGKLECQPRSMLEVTGDFGDGISTRYAVNEVVIQRQGAGMISVETYVNDQMVATYHGDGLIVSTPTGSTAYSLSVGGPVVAPQCACLVLSPVAPHNLTMRPVVIPSSSDVRLKVHARHAEISIATDNETCPIPEGAEFRVRLASRRFFLAVPHNISFYDTLRKKMMWGVDIRS